MRNLATGLRIISLIILTICIYCRPVNAAHLSGGYLTYKHLGADVYEILMTHYRDCDGIGMSTIQSIDIKPENHPSFSITLHLSSQRRIANLCDTSRSNCSSGVLNDFEEYVYRGTVDLSSYASSCWINLSNGISQRPILVFGNFGSLQTRQYIETTFNKCVGPNNTGITFSNSPLMLACTNQEMQFNYGINDPDNDSITMSLTPLLVDSGIAMTYTTSHTFEHPFSHFGFPISSPAHKGPTINAETGQFSFTPTRVEYSSIAWQVSEYRNGQKIADTHFNHNLLIRNCGAEKYPDLSPAEDPILFCANQSNCVDILTSDSNAADTLTIQYRNDIPQATFTTTNDPKPTGTLCWTPATGDIRSEPYLVSFVVNDNSCPYNNKITKFISIKVTDSSSIQAAVSHTLQDCHGQVDFQAIPSSSNGPFRYQWSGDDNFSSTTVFPTHTYSGPGTYHYTLTISSLNTCNTFTYEDSVVIPAIPQVGTGTDTAICAGAQLTLHASGTDSYTWFEIHDPGTILSQTDSLVIHSTVADTLTFVVEGATQINTFSCTSTDTVTVIVHPLPQLVVPPAQAFCSKDPMVLIGTYAPTGPGGVWTGSGIQNINGSWYFDPSTAGIGAHQLLYTYTNPVTTCSGTASTTYTVNPNPQIVVSNSTLSLCQEPMLVDLTASTLVTPLGGTWSGTGVTNGTFDPAQVNQGTYIATYTVVNSHNCKDSAQATIRVNALPNVSFVSTAREFCNDEAPVDLRPLPKDFINGTLSGNGITANHLFDPALAGPGNHWVTFTYTNPNTSCVNADSVQLDVYEKPTVQFTASPLSGEPPLTVNFTDQSTGDFNEWLWNFGDQNSGSNNTSALQNPTHTFQFEGVYDIQLTLKDIPVCTAIPLSKVGYINVEVITGIAETIRGMEQLTVSPNPFGKTSTLSYSLTQGKPITINLYNALGHLVAQLHNGWQEPGLKTYTLTLDEPGIYFLKIVSDNNAVTKKLLKY